VDLFARARDRLKNYPDLRYTETPSSIEVMPSHDSGFPVALLRESAAYVVHFAGWHERFDSDSDALNCFAYGLVGECRLRVDYRGQTAYRWTLEALRDGQ
jgi:hypothetical protein